MATIYWLKAGLFCSKRIKIKFLCLTLLLIASGISLPAQTLFELKYTFAHAEFPKTYKALLTRYSDGSGYVILRYVDPAGYIIGEGIRIELDEEFATNNDGSKDTTTLILKSIAPAYPVYSEDQRPLQDSGYFNYNGPVFHFKKDDSTGYFEPAGVVSPYTGPEKMGTLQDATLLYGLSEQTFLTYFRESDPMFGLFFWVRSPPPVASEVSLYLVVVANTEDNSIGSSTLIDKNAITKYFKEIAEFLDVKFISKQIAGADYNKKNVDKALKSLRPGKNDIVVFYYSGHGYSKTNDKYQYPHLDLRPKSYQSLGKSNALNIEDIYDSIKKKGARLNLVMSDCCNSDPTMGSTIISNIATTRDVRVGWAGDFCKQLFMDSIPRSILMTAAQKGEVSAGNNNIGGIFSYNIRASLDKAMSPLNGYASWDEVLQNIQRKTKSKASNTLCPQEDESYKPCSQNPVYKQEEKK